MTEEVEKREREKRESGEREREEEEERRRRESARGDAEAGSAMAEECITECAYARIGLLGNPSDIYWGKTIALGITNYGAKVTLKPNDRAEDGTVTVVPNMRLDVLEHESILTLSETLSERGYYGGTRLLLSLLKVFADYCKDEGIDLSRSKSGKRGFSLAYESDVPYQIGLSGSSAIICAALKCLVRYYDLKDSIPKPVLPNLMLKSENELGIVAGYMDRVIQVYGGVVCMDFERTSFEENGHGAYDEMDPKLLPELHLMFRHSSSPSPSSSPSSSQTSEEGSGNSGRIHSGVRERWLRGDEEVVQAMQVFRAIAEKGAKMLLDRKLGEDFAALMRRNFNLRRNIFGDEVLGRSNLEMVNLAESVGAAGKFTGSGGAIVVYCPRGQEQAKDLETKCVEKGYAFVKVKVAEPSHW